MRTRFYLLLLVLLATGLSAAAQSDGPAALPTLISTTFPSTTGYTVKTVCASGCDYTSVATAYATEGCKTVLRIRAGQNFQGGWTANKTCTAGNWIILMSDDCTSAGVCTHIPAQGNRNTASLAADMPQISANNNVNETTITIGTSIAYNWFGPGLKITGPDDGATTTNDVTVDAGNGPNWVVWDRDYITCGAAQDCQRGIGFEGANEAVVDSSITQMHSLSAQQAQAIAEFGGVGPYKIVNNLLGSASEPILMGGSDCPHVYADSDIEVAGNDLYYDFGSRSAMFLSSDPGQIRSILEFKEGTRILIQGNYLDASAVAGQNVAALNNALLIWAVAQCSGTTTQTQDFTYRFNKSVHSTAALAEAGGWTSDYMFPAVSFKNGSVHDNLFDDQNQTNGTGKSEIAYVPESFASPNTFNLLTNHNTFISSDGGGQFALQMDCATGGPLAGSQIYTNNIWFAGSFDVASSKGGGGFVFGVPGINQCITGGYTISNNVDVAGTSSNWPGGNFFPATATSVDFTNFNSGSGGNYQLTGASPYLNAATDGQAIGVSNFTCLNSLMTMAINGTYTESAATCASGLGAGASKMSGVTLKGATIR